MYCPCKAQGVTGAPQMVSEGSGLRVPTRMWPCSLQSPANFDVSSVSSDKGITGLLLKYSRQTM